MRDHIRNEEIRKATTVQPIAPHLMQKRLRWYGHVRRTDDSHDKNSAGHGGRRCETQRKIMDTIRRDIKKNLLDISSEEELADGRQYS